MLESLDTLIAFVLIMLLVSLLITIVVQMAAAVFNLRGWNLLVGLKNTFAVIAPDTQDNALSRYSVVNRENDKQRKKLAKYLLKGGLLSDSFLPWWLTIWRHASAVRPSELFDAIHRIAIGKEPANETLKNSARKILIGLGVTEQTINNAAAEITSTAQTAKAFADLMAQVSALESLPDAMKMKLQMARDQLTERLKTAGEAVASQVIDVAGELDSAYQKFHYWTCISQERAEQWLTMHTRLLTVFFAIIAAFALQLDTVEIFKLVSSNKAVREKLVAQAAAVSSQAEKTLGDSPSLLQSAYDRWLPGVKDANVKSALTSPSPPPVKITATDTRETVANQIENALAKIDENARVAALESFGKTVDETVTGDLKDKAHDYAKIQANFEKNTGFELFPDSERGRWNTGRRSYKGHLVGILFSVALLSLGAPFWYNTLKNLVNLRSQVAQNISDEQKQSEAGKLPPAVEPPPTVKPRHST